MGDHCGEKLPSASIVELFGASATESAMREVMATGHVGAEFVEYILRHKRGLAPSAAPLRLGNAELDGIVLPEPDLTIYDRPALTRNPGEPPSCDGSFDIPGDDLTDHHDGGAP